MDAVEFSNVAAGLLAAIAHINGGSFAIAEEQIYAVPEGKFISIEPSETGESVIVSLVERPGDTDDV